MAVTANIHRKLVARLLLGWLVLSIVLSVAVFFIKLESIDEFVEDLAIAESKPLLHDKKFFTLNATEEEREDIVEKLSIHIEQAHFIKVDLYNAKHEKLYEVAAKNIADIEKIEKYFESKDHTSLFSDNLSYKRVFIDGRIFLQVFVPLFDEANNKYGYFEGVYRADDKTMNDVKHLLIGSLLIVVAAVLVTAIIFYPIVMAMNKDLIKLSKDLSDANIGMLEALGSAIAKRDSDTNSHNYRVTIYAVMLGEVLKLKDGQMRSLIKGSFLHDIGKIAISDNILLKPGKLTQEEFEQMKTHVRHGVDIVEKYAWLRDAVDIVAYHHERYDGSGYLGRITGEAIPLNARIFALADVFDALTSKRPYKEPFSYEKTIEILKGDSGKHFDPALLEVFIGLSGELYGKTYNNEDAVLEKTLYELIRKYF